MISVQPEYISAACNQLYNCLDWSIKPPYPIIYGVSSQIFIYDQNERKVKLTLTMHEGQITTLKFINNQKKLMILSGCTKGQLLIWECSNDDPFNLNSWIIKHSFKLQEHILFIKSIETNDSKCLFSCGFIKGKISFFQLQGEEIEELEEIEFGNNVMLAMDFLPINSNCLLIILAGLDFSLHFYCIDQTKNNQLVYISSVKAHDNAVNDISFAVRAKKFDNYTFLATASRDSTIKIWKFSEFTEKIEQNSLLFSKKNHYFLQIQEKTYGFELITALQSHTYHVTSLSWGIIEQDLCLAASSFDSTISLWFPDSSTNAWINKYTLGQLTKSNKDGFFFVTFNHPKYDQLIAYTLQGKFYLWNVIKEDNDWKFLADYCMSGHFGVFFFQFMKTYAYRKLLI